MIDIDFETLRTIGLTPAIAGQLATITNPGPGARLVRVTEVQRGTATVHNGLADWLVRPLPALVHSLEADSTALAVGDWVLAEANDHGEWWIGARLAPFTELARRSTDGRRQVIASNIDTALLVMGLDHDFNLRRLERYLAMVGAAGVAPVLVLTKADTATCVDERIDDLRQRITTSVPVFAVNALSPAAGRALAPWLSMGQALILLGSSGAGKSTLTNTLAASGQPTGAVRRATAAGGTRRPRGRCINVRAVRALSTRLGCGPCSLTQMSLVLRQRTTTLPCWHGNASFAIAGTRTNRGARSAGR